MPFGSSDDFQAQRERIKELETRLADKELEVKRLWRIIDDYQNRQQEKIDDYQPHNKFPGDL